MPHFVITIWVLAHYLLGKFGQMPSVNTSRPLMATSSATSSVIIYSTLLWNDKNFLVHPQLNQYKNDDLFICSKRNKLESKLSVSFGLNRYLKGYEVQPIWKIPNLFPPFNSSLDLSIHHMNIFDVTECSASHKFKL